MTNEATTKLVAALALIERLADAGNANTDYNVRYELGRIARDALDEHNEPVQAAKRRAARHIRFNELRDCYPRMDEAAIWERILDEELEADERAHLEMLASQEVA